MDSVRSYVSVNAFIEQRNKVLLVRVARPTHKRGRWGLPGGKVMPHETFEDALEREVSQETGIGPHLYMATPLEIIHENPESTVKHIYEISLDTDIYEFSFDPDEILEAAWIPLKEVEIQKLKLRSEWVGDFLKKHM